MGQENCTTESLLGNPVRLLRQLEEVLEATVKGEIQIPDFQRGWIWDDDRIRSLFSTRIVPPKGNRPKSV